MILARPISNTGLSFASERDKGTAVKRVHGWTGNPFLELYFIEAKQIKGEECGNVMYGRPEKFSDELNTKYHETAVTFSDDQKKIYFTRNNYENNKAGKGDDGIMKLKVYSADIKGKSDYKGQETWENLKGLPFNSDEYSVAHPTLTVDGKKLFFSSDMPGGLVEWICTILTKKVAGGGHQSTLGQALTRRGMKFFRFFTNQENYISLLMA